MRTITLLDGTHELTPPTFYALQLMSDYGVSFEDLEFTPAVISGMLAAILTDSEPLKDGVPVKTWTPVMAAKLIDPAAVEGIVESLSAVLSEAFPEAKEEVSDRPTKPQSGSK